MTFLDVSRRAALYLRVSTRDQTTENQERELRSWAARLGFELVHLYGETVGGARRDRNELAALLAAAHRREFDVLLIWSLDRLSREGIGPMAGYMGQFRAAGIRVMSHQEPWLDTGGPVGDLLAAVFAWVAQQERKRIGERVRAGQARAKAKGVRFGRRARQVDVEELCRRREAGQGWRRIARAMKTPTSTLRRKFQECQKSPADLGHAPAQSVPPSEGQGLNDEALRRCGTACPGVDAPDDPLSQGEIFLGPSQARSFIRDDQTAREDGEPGSVKRG